MDLLFAKQLNSLTNITKSDNYKLINGVDGIWIRLKIVSSDTNDPDVGETIAICNVLLPMYPNVGDLIHFSHDAILCHEDRIPYYLVIDDEASWPKLFNQTVEISQRTMSTEAYLECIGFLSA